MISWHLCVSLCVRVHVCRLTPSNKWSNFSSTLNPSLGILQTSPAVTWISKCTGNFTVIIIELYNYIINCMIYVVCLCVCVSYRYNEVNALRMACSSGVEECNTLVKKWFEEWMMNPSINPWVFFFLLWLLLNLFCVFIYFLCFMLTRCI